MGAYKYIGELYKKKQSDVLRFLLRVRYVGLGMQERATLILPVIFDLQVLGVPPAERYPSCFPPLSPRQGPSSRLQS